MTTSAARLWTEQLLFRIPFLRPRSAAAAPAAPVLRSFSSTTRAAIPRSTTPTQALHRNALLLLRGERTALSRQFRSLRFKSDKTTSRTPNPTPHLGSPEPALSLSQRFRKLSREYGWLALWVYLGLSVLDFPFCFLLVRTLGVERIGHYEHVIVDSIKSALRIPFPSMWKEAEAMGVALPDGIAEATAREGGEVDEAVVKDGGASACKRPSVPISLLKADLCEAIWTQLGLAYAVHKSLIFFRIPLAGAILPKVARTMRGWGYNVGRAPKPKPT
jgi:hypothetical protein